MDEKEEKYDAEFDAKYHAIGIRQSLSEIMDACGKILNSLDNHVAMWDWRGMAELTGVADKLAGSATDVRLNVQDLFTITRYIPRDTTPRREE